MIRKLVDFALNNRFVVITTAILILLAGMLAFHDMPVEAYPDIADNYVTIISQWPGRSAEEVEQQVTIPIEIQMNGIPHLSVMRSESLFGLSFMTLVFDDASVNDWNRQKVLERLTLVSMPPGVQPQIGTDWSLTGQIYWYTLRSTNPSYDLMDMRSIEDWVLLKEFKSVKDVVDVSDFGGTAREYQVRVDPAKLVSYGLSIGQVEQQLTINNINAGGSFVETGLQQMNVRAIGLYRNLQDIEQTVLTTKNGTPVRVKDIAVVEMGPRIRLGHMARATHRPDGVIVDEPDVIQGSVLMLKGAEEGPTLDAIHEKVKQLNERILPEGVKIIPMLDRSDLLHFTLHTVEHNLVEGMILVTIILLLFLGNVRAALIVAMTIPFSLMFASIWLDLSKIPGQSSVPGRAGFRNDGGRRRGDGRKHRPPLEPAPTTRRGCIAGYTAGTQHGHRENARGGDPRGLPRSATAGVLRHRHHHHRLHADFHAPTRGGQVIQADGLDRGVRSSRRHDLLDPDRTGSEQLVVQQRRQGMAQPGDGIPDQAVSRRGPEGHRSSLGNDRRWAGQLPGGDVPHVQRDHRRGIPAPSR